MKRFLILLALVVNAHAQDIQVKSYLSHDKIAPGQAFRLAVVLELPAPWHCNANPASMPEFIPTTLSFTANEAVTIGKIRYPAGQTVKVSWADEPVALYSGTVTIIAEGKLTGAGPVTIAGTVRYQACDDQVCYAPKTVPVTWTVETGGDGRAIHSEVFAAGEPNAAARREPRPPNSIDDQLKTHGLWLTLFFIFLGGLALNLTPCVFPLIAITVSYFGGAGQRKLGHAFAYFAGIVLTYSTLGLVAALTGGLFGAALQSPWVLIGVAALMVALALSMFGLFEIQPPQFLMQRATGLSAKVGLIGVFFLGATVGIIAAPCIGPIIVGVLLFVAQRGDPWLGWWMFFTLASGLGLPYVILGAFSGLLTKLPKSGTWMVWVKRVFGIVFLGVAIWFLQPLFGSKPPVVSPIAWQPYTAAAIANPGKPVVLDFYADWCVPCHEMDKTTLRDAGVVEKAKEFVMLKADLTRTGSPEVEQLTQKFQIRGVPTYIFLDATGREHAELRQVGFTGASEFLRLMERAQSPAATNAGPVAPISPELMHPF
ncbi:MAG: cytochrome c biogenesis protein CcdA [Verrucomicrobiota bacterium]